MRGVLFTALILSAVCFFNPYAFSEEEFIKDPKFLKQVSREEVLSQTHTPVYKYEVVREYPHDTSSYTEGLFMHDGKLYESTGRYSKSKVIKSDLKTGKPYDQIDINDIYFGEGITILKDRVYHLTYKSNKGFIYDKDKLSTVGGFNYPYQGWGMTTDGEHLIMSNGSSALLFLDPETLEEKKYLIVRDQESEVGFLNELEYIKGEVYANVWQSDFIVRISPETGEVLGWIDLNGLNPDPEKLKYPYVLNGIAYLEEEDLLLITGKCWPKLYAIKLVPYKNIPKE